MGFRQSEETKDTQTWETARGQRGPEWRRRARGGDQTKGRTLTDMPAPGPAPPQRRPTRRVPGQQVHILCWERHTCERRPEQTRLCPRQARLPPCRRGCFLAWATRPAEEPGRVRGQSVAGSRGCVCPCALGSPTAALTTPLQCLRLPTCLLSLTGRFPVRPQLPPGKRVAKFAE